MAERWTWFGRKGISLRQRMMELQVAPNLLDIKKLSHLKLHCLKGKNRYSLAIDINGRKDPNRIVFECLNGENICDDWLNDSKLITVTKIKILFIWDYH